MVLLLEVEDDAGGVLEVLVLGLGAVEDGLLHVVGVAVGAVAVLGDRLLQLLVHRHPEPEGAPHGLHD